MKLRRFAYLLPLSSGFYRQNGLNESVAGAFTGEPETLQQRDTRFCHFGGC
jgi:hypothetical protein